MGSDMTEMTRCTLQRSFRPRSDPTQPPNPALRECFTPPHSPCSFECYKKSAPVRQIGRSDPLSNEWSSNYWWDTKFATKKENRTVGPVLFTLHVSHNPNFLLVSLRKEVTHRPGRPREINFMSRYICFSQNGPFDVSFEELFSKAKNPGGFFRKIVF